MQEQILLKLNHVRVWKEDRKVLSDINLELYAGEVHAVTGMQMPEMQYLFQMMQGTLGDVRGEILVQGIPGELGLRGKKIGIVQTGIEVIPDLTAWENILFGKTRGVRLCKRKEQQIVQQLLNQFGIDLDLKKRAGLLSHEEQKILSVLRVYLENKPIVAMQDPFRDVNMKGRDWMTGILSAMKERGQGVLFITAHLDDALLIADRISVMEGAAVRKTLRADEALREPTELMYTMTGWDTLWTDEDSREKQVLDSIVSAREVLSSSSELQKELQFLAHDLTKLMKADQSVVFLANEDIGRVVEVADSSGDDLSLRKIPQKIFWYLIRHDEILSFGREDKQLEDLFAASDWIETVFYMPIQRKEKTQGGILIFYNRAHELDENERRYLRSFSKEIAIAIETSKLLGRSVLLQESHHRIKNNLQMIVSMLYMQKLQFHEEGGDVDEIFNSIISRISSIALVHNLMAQDESDSSIVNLHKIIEEIVRVNQRADVRIEMDVENISIPYNKATSISLTVNELITNSIKHAFAGRSDNRILVSAHNDGKNIELIVADNGNGFAGQNPVHSTSLGLTLIRGIVSDMDGTFDMDGTDGCCSRIVIPRTLVYDAKNTNRQAKGRHAVST